MKLEASRSKTGTGVRSTLLHFGVFGFSGFRVFRLSGFRVFGFGGFGVSGFKFSGVQVVFGWFSGFGGFEIKLGLPKNAKI